MPKVSVVTRTCDRLPLLKRCLQSIQQTGFNDLEWIVVDDAQGGSDELSHFLQSIAPAIDARSIRSGARHRAKAANAGLAAASGELIHFLDDDDTVAPDFYRKTASFLAGNERFGAVVTHAERVIERLMPDNSLRAIERLPHYPETQAISLAELAVVQIFAPVSFVARRTCIEAIGGFDERFEVCEDYDLYLRFLTRFDIGVVPEVLCAFHQREGGSGSDASVSDASVPDAWLNSLASRQHRIEDKLFRNALLRQDLEQGKIGLGWLLALGDMTRGSWRLNLALDALQRRKWPRALLRWLRRSR